MALQSSKSFPATSGTSPKIGKKDWKETEKEITDILYTNGIYNFPAPDEHKFVPYYHSLFLVKGYRIEVQAKYLNIKEGAWPQLDIAWANVKRRINSLTKDQLDLAFKDYYRFKMGKIDSPHRRFTEKICTPIIALISSAFGISEGTFVSHIVPDELYVWAIETGVMDKVRENEQA